MATKVRTWSVITHDNAEHPFTSEAEAVAFAMLMAWSDRATTVITPEGGRYVILRRSLEVAIQVVRTI